MGVRLSTITPAIADRFGLSVRRGALVVEVTGGGPADDAGLQTGGDVSQFQDTSIRPDGDVIVSVDGHPVSSSDQFIRLVATDSPGQVVHLKVVRNGSSRNVAVTLGVRPL
jgi:S1-C subfamily serine protease